MTKLFWTDYLKYKLELRGFELLIIESIVKHSNERYFDTSSQRSIVIGKHNTRLVMIPYEINAKIITPVTVHATNRQQINYRLKSGRLINE